MTEIGEFPMNVGRKQQFGQRIIIESQLSTSTSQSASQRGIRREIQQSVPFILPGKRISLVARLTVCRVLCSVLLIMGMSQVSLKL